MALAFDAIVFDLDGTLVDSAFSITEAVNALLAENGHGPLPVEAVRMMIGDGVPKLMERALAAAGLPADEPDAARRHLARVSALLEQYPPDPDRIYPEVRETLDRLAGQGCKLAICSNKPAAAVEKTLKAIGLDDLFAAVVGGDSLPQRKPEAEPVLAALRLLQRSPERAAMVGDSSNDVAAARVVSSTP